MILLFGTARSGTTWLAKLFDSHPDTFYLHEPDISDRGTDLIPFWFENAPTREETDRAAQYLARLSLVRNLRTTGQGPFFKKSYRGEAAEISRRAMILGAKALERVGPSKLSPKLPIPDLISRHSKPKETVIKTVSALGRAGALLDRAPQDVSPMLLLRHPCAFVHSMLRGEKIGVMPPISIPKSVAATRSARRLGFDVDALAQLSKPSQLAWMWLIANAEAYAPIANRNGIIVRYEDLAGDPLRQASSLFEKLGLGWPDEVATFLKASTSASRQGGYYSIFRDPARASGQWREELDSKAIADVAAVACRDPIGAQFFSN